MPAPTFHPAREREYLAAGGAWDRPSLDSLLTNALLTDGLLTDEASAAVAERVARIAGGLRARGVGAGTAVAWQSPNRDEVALLYRACWRLGAVATPIHHQAGAQDARRMLAALAPTVVVDNLDALPEGPAVSELWADAQQLAAVLWTSGSSGAPKGVLHTQATLAYKAVGMAGAHGLGADDCVLMPAPCAHISGLLNGITLPGIVPFRSVFMARWDPEQALDLIEREQVTFMVGPPTFFLALMHAPGFAPSRVASLRLISSGGAGVSEAFVEEAVQRIGARVKRTYGSTEAPTVVTEGRAIGEVEVRVDANGELLVRGPEVCVGYLDPAQTDDAFTADGWFRTGDLASITADGIIDIVGRLKEVIIRGGENIASAEIETLLEAHPAVRQAVAVGEPDELLGERIAAFVVTVAPFDLDTARAWFAEQGAARYKTPERIVVVDTLPLLPTGKADRVALRARLLPG